jgi:PAS domain S-box-containing protein
MTPFVLQASKSFSLYQSASFFEKKLDEQKAFYEKILNTLPIEIAVFDDQHNYLFLNPASIKNDDFRKFIIGKDDFEYCEFRKKDKSIAQIRRDQFLKVKENGMPIQWEDSVTDENGKIFSSLRGMVPVYNEKEKLITVIGFGIDITERKMAEKKLIENEAILSTILETLPVAVFCKDIKNDFKYTLWNKKAEEIFNVKSEICIGKEDHDFFPKKHADWFRKCDIESSKTKVVIDIPEEIVQSGNHQVLVHTRKITIRDNEGNPLFLIGVSEDITERKKAEEKIKKSEEKYRSVVENAADMIITFDMDNKITFINHLRPGTSAEQIVGTSIFNLTPLEYHEPVKQKIKKVFEEKKSQSYELPGKHIDGTLGWYSSKLSPVFSDNEVTGITLILRDITESKKAEEVIQKSLKEKEILLKEVHHRVKNNLQIMLSILNLQYAKLTDKKTLNLVRDIRSRIKAMSFIHELLYQTDDFSSINFSEYITSITNNLIYSYTQSHSIDLKLDVGTIFLDLDQAIPCGLIINEIVTNSLKYGIIDQENGEVAISLTKKNELIQLVISDNGKGFPDTIDYKNTESLGMQLVVTLVEQLGGNIELDNSNGATYTITFKVLKENELLTSLNNTAAAKN